MKSVEDTTGNKMVGAGKDRSGFHGTTIQAVYSNQVKKNYKLN
jgi:hypothetical protein